MDLITKDLIVYHSYHIIHVLKMQLTFFGAGL